MLQDELKALLRELATAIGAARVGIVHCDPAPPRASDDPDATRYEPLGNKTYLCIEPAQAGPDPGPESRKSEHAAAIARAVRAVRAAGRRWQAERLPTVTASISDGLAPGEDRVTVKVAAFLEALANTQNARVVTVTVRGRVVAASTPLEELERERLPFLLRRVAAEAQRREGSSHAELIDPDVYVANFWFDACLVAFFVGPWATDFFRHRARMVMRELSQILPLLDEPPPSPASVAPIPD